MSPEENSQENRLDQELEEGEIKCTDPALSEEHTLECRWTLWFDNPHQKQSTAKFGQSLRPVAVFDSVEAFWRLYNNIKSPGQLLPSATFYLFKEGIEPKWEDPTNSNGGSWIAPIPGSSKSLLDAWWLNGVLACIGEQFTEGDEICGIACNVRAKGDRIELWTKTCSDEAKQVSIGRELKKFLDCEHQKLAYTAFHDSLTSRKANNRYSV